MGLAFSLIQPGYFSKVSYRYTDRENSQSTIQNVEYLDIIHCYCIPILVWHKSIHWFLSKLASECEKHLSGDPKGR